VNAPLPRPRTAVAALLALLLAGPSPAAAQDTAPATAAATAADAASDAAAVTFRVDSGLRLVAAPEALVGVSGVSGTVGGLRFLDTVEVLARRGGLDVVNELDFDTYLYGLAEVPRSWPEAVLEAQVIAARTYAWHVMGLATYADYDICATTACQVFRGAEVLLAEGGERWRSAVDATSGQVLVDADGPILARYFSTSGGRTYPNEVVFPSSGPRPYLVGIDDPYDALSPVHRWEVRFLRREFNALLALGETLSAVAPYERIERLGAVDDTRALIRVTGRDGERVELPAIVLRDFLSSRAPLLFPDRFPPLRADRERPLPSTIPTTRYAIEQTNFEVVFSGLGWGHGVGMGQWGAHARALDGHDAAEILAAYYNGLRPSEDARVPGRIRAGMGSATLDDGLGLHVTLHEPTELRTLDGRPLVTGLGTWRIARDRAADGSATGTALEVSAPAGWGEPLTLSPTRLRPSGATIATTEDDDVAPAARFDVRTVISGPVRLQLAVSDADGVPLYERDLGLAERGLYVTSWQAVDAQGAPLAPGGYRVALIGTDVDGVRAGSAATIELVAAPLETSDAPGTSGEGPTDGAPDSGGASADADGGPTTAVGDLLARIGLGGLGVGLVAAALLLMLATVAGSRLRRRRGGDARGGDAGR
jgi:SpoIID/LytB domain protein